MPLSLKLSMKGVARDSALSRRQVEEVRHLFPHIHFEMTFVKTHGDRDRKTSLRDLDKTDFFTQELDALVLRGECDVAIHSAKDLPDPLPKGLVLAVLTQGIDPSDSLVLREGSTLEKGMSIATSSMRREEMVRQLEPDVHVVDIRGTIEERLAHIEEGRVDGVVIAEAALIRLELTHLNRVRLPGEAASLQGKLALITKEGNQSLLLSSALNGLP